MEYLDNITIQALYTYFNALPKVGYISDKKVYQLILLVYLSDFLEEYPITEDDFKKISRIITCLQQASCIIPYSQYVDNREPIEAYIYAQPIRTTEDTDIRTTEAINVRVVNQ